MTIEELAELKLDLVTAMEDILWMLDDRAADAAKTAALAALASLEENGYLRYEE